MAPRRSRRWRRWYRRGWPVRCPYRRRAAARPARWRSRPDGSGRDGRAAQLDRRQGGPVVRQVGAHEQAELAHDRLEHGLGCDERAPARREDEAVLGRRIAFATGDLDPERGARRVARVEQARRQDAGERTGQGYGEHDPFMASDRDDIAMPVAGRCGSRRRGRERQLGSPVQHELRIVRARGDESVERHGVW